MILTAFLEGIIWSALWMAYNLYPYMQMGYNFRNRRLQGL